MLSIEGGRSCLYQWDVDQRLQVDHPEVTEVHFSNSSAQSALICEVYEEDGVRYANIPNILLQEPFALRAHGCCEECVRVELIIRVVSRAKPADYVYTETEVRSFETLMHRAEEAVQVAEETLAGLYREFSVSGQAAICHPAEGSPLHVISRIEAVQSGSGEASPDNVRPISGWDNVNLWCGGINLINPSELETGGVQSNGVQLNGMVARKRTPFIYLDSGTYSITTKGEIYAGAVHKYSDANMSNWISKATIEQYGGTKTTITFTLEEACYIRVVFTSFDDQKITDDMIIEASPLLCKTHQTLTAQLPETIYGGEYDWTTGLLTVDKLCIIYDGSEDWIMGTSTAGLTTFHIGSKYDSRMAKIKQQSNYDNYKFITSHFNWVRYYAPEKPEHSAFMVDSSTGRTMYIVNSAWSTEEDCAAYLAAQAAAGTPLTCVFDLGEPYTIQLTPQEILALSGVNTLFSDTGDTEVSGRMDPRRVISSLEERIAALEAATINNV